MWGLPFMFVPRVDGNFVPEDPIKLMKEGKYNKVNIMMGGTRDEGGIITLGE